MLNFLDKMACTQLVLDKQLVILFKMAAANGHDCAVDLYTRNSLMCAILLHTMRAEGLWGKFHDQGDAKWIVIRGELRTGNPWPAYRLPRGWPPSGCIWFFELLLTGVGKLKLF
jgi:hypothetical protein